MPPNIDKILDRHKRLTDIKAPWLPLYQALAMYVILRKQYFTVDYLKTPFILNYVFDSTAVHAANILAASLMGQILPNPYESFEFVPQVAQDPSVEDDTYEFFQTVNQVMAHIMANPDAGLMTAIEECLRDMGIFGIGAVATDETNDLALPVRYTSVDAKVMSIDEDQYGRVNTIHLEKLMRVVQIVEKYGYESCSEVVQKKYDGLDFDAEMKVLQAIEPRRERNPLKLGNLDMPFASVHLELDQKHPLLESGYNENPITVARFWKNPNEVQGRSPAMSALADIRAVNKLVEMFEMAGEMGLRPPKMISSEDVLGAGKIPWGPDATIPVHYSGRMGTDRIKPIEIIHAVDNPSWAVERIQNLQANIKEYFMVDYLTDLNNRSRQTLGEADIRNEKGMYITGSILNRCLVELLGPILDRTFNILLSKGFFGVIKGSVQDLRMQAAGIKPRYVSRDFIRYRMQGLKGYRLNFISPAARLMKLEEAKGQQDLLQVVLQVATVKPEALDNINFDEYIRRTQRLEGASSKVMNTPDQVEEIRKQRSQMSQEQQQQQAQMVQAHALKLVGAGVKDLADAGVNAQSVLAGNNPAA
ncbi:MAG: hypothetical protein KGL39_23120 [Patescibacteria group bacterium]|nr:hypothetical protein [Patescibacteria group bacterium]